MNLFESVLAKNKKWFLFFGGYLFCDLFERVDELRERLDELLERCVRFERYDGRLVVILSVEGFECSISKSDCNNIFCL